MQIDFGKALAYASGLALLAPTHGIITAQQNEQRQRVCTVVRSLQSIEAEYVERTPASRAQWERGRSVMPAGVIKGAFFFPPHPLYMDRADGCYMWDLDGNRYVDFANHHSSTILGHNHPAVVEALEGELRRGFALGAPTALEAEIAEEIVSRIPGVDQVRYTNSATESALHTARMVRAITGKPKVAKFEGAYHGSHDALEYSTAPAPDDAGPEDAPIPVPAQDGMIPGSEESVIILPYNQPETVEMILREHKDEVAAVYYDGKPAMMDIAVEFTKFVRDITEELGMLMVMDETVSFMAGPGGYQREAGVEPDLSFFGKILGGGLPGGAIGGKAEVMALLDNSEGSKGIFQSGTFSGNSMTIAAGLATLRALTPEVYAHIDTLRERAHAGLEEASRKAGQSFHVLSAGTIINAFPTDKPVRDHRSFADVDTELFERILLGLTVKGNYMGRGHMSIVLSEPMGTGDVDGLVTAFDEVLSEED